MEIKDYIIGILFSLVVGLGLWLSYEIKSRDVKTVTKTDSTTVVERDTIHSRDTVRVIGDIEIPPPDTVYREKEDDELLTRTYNTTISDSLISGSIETTVRGYLVDQNFQYTPEYPLQIRVNTNTVVNRTVTRTIQPKGYPTVGLTPVTDLETLRGIEVNGGWTLQNGNSIEYEYNPVMKTHGLELSYNLRNLFK